MDAIAGSGTEAHWPDVLGHGRSWMLRLCEVPGLSPVRVGLLVAVVLTPLSVVTGNPYITPVILGYAVWVTGHVVHRQQEELEELAPLLDDEPVALERIQRDLAWHPRLLLALAWLAGPLAMGLINWSGPALTALRSGTPADTGIVVGLALAALFWTVCIQLFTILLRNALVFHRLGAHRLNVDLLDVQGLTPLGRVAVRNLLIFVGAYALIPLALVQSTEFVPSVMAAVAVTAPLSAVLLFLPLTAIHRRLARAKAAELVRIRRALHGDRAALADSPIRENAEELSLTSLVLYRELIRQTKEWPINTPMLLRLATYVVIPLLAWVAAAIVEHYVDRLL